MVPRSSLVGLAKWTTTPSTSTLTHQNPPPALRIHTLLPLTNLLLPTTILLECKHSLRLLLRSNLWEEYREADPALEEFIKSSSPLAATRVLMGLQLLNSR